VRVRVLFGVSYGAVDTKLLCNPGKDGASGDGGDPGTKGVHGNHPSSYDFAPAADGKDGAHGAKIAGAKQTAAACTIDAAGQCTTSDLLVGLHVPMSGYLFMLLETIRSAMLAAGVTATVHNVISAASPPGAQGAPDDDKLSLRMSWLGSLLNLYTPLSGGEMSTLDGLRSVATMMARRWAAGLDYYGHSAMYAPLGSMDLHLDAFTHAVNSYDDAQQRLAQLSGAATTGTNETDLLAQTKAKLQADQTAYDTAANDLRKQIPTILDSIKLRQADLDGARAKLLTPDAQALHDALRSEFSANAADVFECLSQFAFFPEMGPQKGAMMIGQLGKLIYNGATKVRLDDEQTAGKDYLIQQLAEVSDFSTALGELSTKGTTEGIALADPGAVKLLSLKKDLDAFCEKLFVKHPAAEKLKKDFDDFVTSVQQRNADIVAFNETLSLLEGYLAGSNQTAASLSDDGEDIAFRGSPGAPTMTAQANRMLQRSRDDAIHQLYLASRAYFMWALDPDDQLSKNLSLFAGGNDLALEPETLNQVESAMYVTRAQAIDARLSDGGGWRPDRAAPLQARGIFAEFTNATHPEALKALLTKSADGIYSTVLILPAVRFGTAVEGSLFGTVGVADVRLRRVRAWIIGARTEDQILQLTISHIGRETMVTPMDEPMDVHHPKLDVQMSYDMSFGECNPQCLANVRQANADGDILFDADGLRPQKVPLAGLVGPFGAWKVSLRDLDNRKLDMSGVTAVRFEFFCHVRAFDSDAIVSGIQHH